MSYSDSELYSYAKGLREECDLDQFTPIKDLESLVKNIGHELRFESFGDEFSATCFPISPFKFGIVLNSDVMWNDRFKNFTLAHELGHTVLPEHLKEMKKKGQLKTRARFQSDKIIEREADKFAASFLAPRPLFLDLISELNFNKQGLKEISNELNISLLTGAFRFLKLTDLACSLIVVDSYSETIKYEFRSELMKKYNKQENLKGSYPPYQGSVSEILVQPAYVEFEDRVVELSDYYPKNKIGLSCRETVFRLDYNNSVVVMLTVIEEMEEYF